LRDEKRRSRKRMREKNIKRKNEVKLMEEKNGDPLLE